MLIASDGNAYVVKFANNPQSPRVLVNEWLACSIGRALGLTIPEPAILHVPAELVESSPSSRKRKRAEGKSIPGLVVPVVL